MYSVLRTGTARKVEDHCPKEAEEPVLYSQSGRLFINATKYIGLTN
jgi:hypothetical protein